MIIDLVKQTIYTTPTALSTVLYCIGAVLLGLGLLFSLDIDNKYNRIMCIIGVIIIILTPIVSGKQVIESKYNIYKYNYKVAQITIISDPNNKCITDIETKIIKKNMIYPKDIEEVYRQIKEEE